MIPDILRMPLALLLTGVGLLPNSADGAPASVVYRAGDDLFRLQAAPDAVPEAVMAAFPDAGIAGPDRWINQSPDGEWLLVETERFDPDCHGWACLARIDGMLTAVETLRPMGGAVLHPDGFAAIANSGNLVVFPASDGPNDRDLYATQRIDGVWTAPTLLTGASTHAYNEQPALSADGAHVIFDCGPVPYGQTGTGLCSVQSDGSNFEDVLLPGDGDAPIGTLAIHHPAFAPDGSLVMEIEAGGERIYRPSGTAGGAQVIGSFNNDNSPCVLPDGRIVSLWLGAPDNTSGLHELKLMGADGNNAFRPLPGIDVSDIGIGCGGGSASVAVLFANGFE